MTCRCESCFPENPSQTATEKFRKECEAKEVMRWPGGTRQNYYEKVKKHRGESAVMDLIEEVKRQWNISNKQAQKSIF